MRILLLSAYDAASHRVWREGLIRSLPAYDWTVLTLPPRFFAWRSLGNPLSWAFGERATLEKGFDLVLTTSMTNFAALKGIVPSLAATPSVVYFHENQFAYPEQRARKEYQNYKLANLYTALAADRVLFNSQYNLKTFTEGAAGLLSIMPDHVPKGIVESVKEKSDILPVPIADDCYRPGQTVHGPLRIVWNHRWEHDKAPERLFDALDMLRAMEVPFYLHLMGQGFRDLPPGFNGAKERFGDCALTWGFVDDEEKYRRILASADVVISTALHDFQGLAVLEAVAAGCLPLVPDRLAYPEFFPKQFRYDSHENDKASEVMQLVNHLEGYCRDPEEMRKKPVPDISHLSWKNLGPRYEEILEEVCSG